MSVEDFDNHNRNILFIKKKKSRRSRLHNYIAERSRRNRRSEANVFNEDEDEAEVFCRNEDENFNDIDIIVSNNVVKVLDDDADDFEQAAIIAMKDVFAVVDEEIKVDVVNKITIRSFHNIISMLIEITKFFLIDDENIFVTKSFCRRSNQ